MISMKWTDMKQNINSISQEEKNLIELTALLTSIRKDKNITQKDLANKVDVTQAQIARVENYSYTPTLKTITKIASYFKIFRQRKKSWIFTAPLKK